MGLFDFLKKDKETEETAAPAPEKEAAAEEDVAEDMGSAAEEEDPVPEESAVWLYSEEDMAAYEAYVESTFGEYHEAFHEILSPDIHLDVIVIPPKEETPYYTLVTAGAGAYPMEIPEDLAEFDLTYAEYIICLPADWDIYSGDKDKTWPLLTLKSVARLPVTAGTWLGVGHTLHVNRDMSPVAPGTKLNSIVLLPALDIAKREVAATTLPSGKKINIYQLMPLYQEELDYKMEKGYDTFLDLLTDEMFPLVVDPDREPLV